MPRSEFPKHVASLAHATLLRVQLILRVLPPLYHHFFVVLAHRLLLQLEVFACLRVGLFLVWQVGV